MIYAEIESICLQVSRPDPWAHIQILNVQCVCVCVTVCVYTHIHSRVHPSPSKIEEDTDKTPISPSVKNNPPRQATSALQKLE